MRIKPGLALNLVVVAVIGGLMVAWVVTQIVGSGAFNQPYAVTADFESSGGVFTNQEVTYRGVLVGRVGDLSLNDGGVTIELLIDPEWEGEIPSDVTAKVQSKSAVGEQFVNLTPSGSSDGEMLSDGDSIAREDTELPVDFQSLLASLDRVLGDVDPATTRRLVANLADGLEGRSRDIATILESLGKVSDAFADVAPEQRRLFTNATTAGSEFLRTKDEFARAIRAADQVLAGIGDEPEELRALLANNDRLARATLTLLGRHSRDIENGIAELSRFVSFQLRESDELIVKTLDYVPAFMRAVEEASIPWRSPDGREFYRIRVGLVFDNVRRSWPCKYRVPEEWERFPHVRSQRVPKTSMKCLPTGSTETASLLAAIEDWSRDDPDPSAPSLPSEGLASTADATADPPASDGGFIWPVDGEVTSGFGSRDGGEHTGLDIDADTGTAVVAAASGRVVHTGVYYGYGETVIVDHGRGFSTLYGHLSAIDVKLGDEVTQGDAIGLVGCSGDCTGDHLHFEIRVDGEPIDPIPYLPGGRFADLAVLAPEAPPAAFGPVP
jgi:virulence factor Mce-like protein